VTDDPFAERRRNGFATFRPSEPAAGRYDELAQSKSKAELVDEILFRKGDMHSHYDIDARDGGFALVRTFEIDDEMLEEYGVPDEQVFGWSATLDQMHDRIIKHEERGFSRWTGEALGAAAGVTQSAGQGQSQ